MSTTHTLFYEKDEKIGYIVLLAFKRVIVVHILFYYKLNTMIVELVGIYSTLGGQKRARSHIHWSMFRPNPALRLLYSNLPPPMRGMNSVNPIVYGDRTSGT